MPAKETSFERKSAVPEPRVTLRGVFHALIVLSAWLLFWSWWGRVLPLVRRDDAVAAILLIALSTLVTVVLTAAWVRHNLSIFRLKGPRTGLPAVSETRDADSLGRPIRRSGGGPLNRARIVSVTVDEDAKTFEPGGDA